MPKSEVDESSDARDWIRMWLWTEISARTDQIPWWLGGNPSRTEVRKRLDGWTISQWDKKIWKVQATVTRKITAKWLIGTPHEWKRKFNLESYCRRKIRGWRENGDADLKRRRESPTEQNPARVKCNTECKVTQSKASEPERISLGQTRRGRVLIHICGLAIVRRKTSELN